MFENVKINQMQNESERFKYVLRIYSIRNSFYLYINHKAQNDNDKEKKSNASAKMCTIKINTHHTYKYLRLIVPFRQISVILSIRLFHIIYL